MDPVSAVLLGVLIVLGVIWLRNSGQKRIPGPYGFPIIGSITRLGTKPYVILQEWGKKYGSIFSVQLGSRNVIVLNDFESTRDAFAQEAFMGRPPENPFELSQTTLSTGAFNDLPWKEQRRVSLQLLKDLGFGKSHLEDMMKEEITELLSHFESFDQSPSALRPLLAPSMSNNIGILVFGKRLPFDDPDRAMLDRSLADSAAAAAQTGWQLFFPWFAKIAKSMNLTSNDKVAAALKDFKDYAKKQVAEHEQTLNPNNIRDYIDGYLLEIKKRNERAFSKDVLQDLVGAFFGAGSETVRLSIEWLMLAMAGYPEVQKKVQAEIDEVVGQSRLPSWSDHPRMPYSQATIFELMRWRSIIPINLLRYTLWDTELNGFFIPKHSYILANFWSIHHNKKYFGQDADAFRPERFLSENSKEVKKFEQFIPFSIGKRSCPGEMFAKTEIFLYFTSLMQKFNVSTPNGKSVDFDGTLGIGLTPKPQELRLQKRL